jgi:hypothetical protein
MLSLSRDAFHPGDKPLRRRNLPVHPNARLRLRGLTR